MTAYTVLGASGFIGSRLAAHLEATGRACFAPGRDEPIDGRELGRVIDCAGVTGDFVQRPEDAVEAHVCRVLELVRTCRFESLVYLSSTRVYKRHGDGAATEGDALRLDPTCLDDLYGLSKATGESIALAAGERTRVVRLSNVYGDGLGQPTFLSAVLEQAVSGQTVTLHSSLDSARDYVSVADVVELLPRIAAGRERVYNVAGGVNVTNRELLAALTRLTCCEIAVEAAAPTVVGPRIDVERVRAEFGFSPASVLDDLPGLVETAGRLGSGHALD